MRVTSAVREYVSKIVFAKVQARYDAAKKASDTAKSEYAAKVKKAEELAEKLATDAQAKFEKSVKSLGLTWIEKTCNWSGDPLGDSRRAIVARVSSDDFAETVPPAYATAKANPNVERDRLVRLAEEPERIKAAARTAANKLLFELELGKVAKKELDEALAGLEVTV